MRLEDRARLTVLVVAALACVTAVAASALAQAPLQGRTAAPRSGQEFMSQATRSMQRDDSLNPGMLWVREGEQLWSTAPRTGSPSCAGCHGDAARSMKGVAPRYPAHDDVLDRAVNLGQRIDQCRHRHQQLPLPAAETPQRLALETFVAHQSRGLPLAPPGGARMDAERERGRALFQQRFGQLDLSCAMCHDGNAGGRLGGSTIPEGHANGYPSYRLEWQDLGSLQRRLRNCMVGVRAQPFGFDSPEVVALESWLQQRGRGLTMETPAVRP